MKRFIKIFLIIYFLSLLSILDADNSQNLSNINLPDLKTNKPVNIIQKYGNKPIVISFFTGYCYPCKKELPELQSLQKNLGDSVNIILIASDESKNRLNRFLRDMNITLPILWDKECKVAERFQISSFPTLFVFSKKGKMILDINGYNPSSIDKLRKLFKKK